MQIATEALDEIRAEAMLDAWLAWARRSRLGSFVKLAKTTSAQPPESSPLLNHGLSNARAEAINAQIPRSPAAPSSSTSPKPSSR